MEPVYLYVFNLAEDYPHQLKESFLSSSPSSSSHPQSSLSWPKSNPSPSLPKSSSSPSSSSPGPSSESSDIMSIIRNTARKYGLLSFGMTIWHTSLVVYGHEISYNCEGVEIRNLVKENGDIEDRDPVEKVIIAYTDLSLEDIRNYVESLKTSKFTADNYHVLSNNCNAFTKYLRENLFNKCLQDDTSLSLSNTSMILSTALGVYGVLSLVQRIAKLLKKPKSKEHD